MKNPAEMIFSEKELASFSPDDRMMLFAETERFVEKYGLDVLVKWRDEMRSQASIVWGFDPDPPESKA